MALFEDFIIGELPLRIVLIKGTGATGDPRLSSLPQVNLAPIGTLYLQDELEPKVTWQKQGAASDKWVVISGNFGKIEVRRGLVVTNAFEANEPMDLDSGDGDTSGTATTSGDSVTIPSDYLGNHVIEFYLNGILLEKGVQILHTGGKININIPLDPQDRLIVKSEESI